MCSLEAGTMARVYLYLSWSLTQHECSVISDSSGAAFSHASAPEQDASLRGSRRSLPRREAMTRSRRRRGPDRAAVWTSRSCHSRSAPSQTEAFFRGDLGGPPACFCGALVGPPCFPPPDTELPLRQSHLPLRACLSCFRESTTAIRRTFFSPIAGLPSPVPLSSSYTSETSGELWKMLMPEPLKQV